MRAFPAVFLVLVLAAVATSCSQKPEVAMRDLLASGDRYMVAKEHGEAIIQYRNAVKRDPNSGEARLKLADALAATGDVRVAFGEYVRAADLLPANATAQLRAGQLLLMAKQYPEARARADRILALNPKSVDGLLLMGNALAGLKEFDKAIDQIENAIGEDPGQPFNYANLASIQSAKGDAVAAESAFRRAVEVDPQSPDARWSLGGFYWASGRTAEAESEFKAAYRINPKSPVILRGLAAFYMANRRIADAEMYLKLHADSGDVQAKLALADFYVLASRPVDAKAVLEPLAHDPAAFAPANTRLSVLAHLGGDSREAYQLIDAALQRAPQDESALLTKSNFLLTDKKPADALTLADGAVAANPKSPRALYSKAAALRGLRRPNDAARALQELLVIRPSDVPAQVMLAEVYLSQGKTAPAAELSAQAVASQPQSWTAHLVSARVAVAQANYPFAESELNKLVKATPNAPDVHVLMGDMFLQRRNVPRARQAYERARSLDPRQTAAVLGLIRSDLEEKKFDSARGRATVLLESGADDPVALTVAGATFADSGDYTRAEAAFRKTIEKDPTNLDAYVALGRLYLGQNRLDEARKEYEDLARRQPDLAVSSNTVIGTILAAQGKREEARKYFEQAVSVDSEASAVAANNLAWDYAENGGNLDTALQLAQRAKAQMPQSADASDTLGWIYYKKGLASLAVSALKESVAQNAANPVSHYHLGLAYLADGKRNEAQRALTEALRLKPQFASAQDAKRVLATLKE